MSLLSSSVKVVFILSTYLQTFGGRFLSGREVYFSAEVLGLSLCKIALSFSCSILLLLIQPTPVSLTRSTCVDAQPRAVGSALLDSVTSPPHWPLGQWTETFPLDPLQGLGIREEWTFPLRVLSAVKRQARTLAVDVGEGRSCLSWFCPQLTWICKFWDPWRSLRGGTPGYEAM